jgi:16S rRNA (guanine(966)-N(2))-methyltransferase RsmD
VRGALFNMLEHRGLIVDAALLDLFAGSGALGIEALSRGARSVVFVDASPRAARAVRDNVRASGYRGRVDVVEGDVVRAVRTLGRRGVRFDGVMADPPFGRALVQRTLDAVAAAGVVAPGGWIAIEHRRDEVPVPPGGFELVAARRHGASVLVLLRRVEPTPEEVPS